MSVVRSSRRRGLRLRRCLDSNAWKGLETREKDLASSELLSLSIIEKMRSSLSRSNKERLPLRSEPLLRFCIALSFRER